MSAIVAFLVSGTGRRLIAFILGWATVALNKRLGLALDASELTALVVTVLGYVGQSAGKEAVQAMSDAKVEAAKAAGVAAAKEPVAAING